MAKTKQISLEKRITIIAFHKKGDSVRNIAKAVGVSIKGVHATIKRYKDTREYKDRQRTGRPRATTSAEDQSIVLISKRNRRLTAPEVRSQFNSNRNRSVSVTTVKRRLRAAGLMGRVAVRKPLLRQQNRRKRLQWAKAHKNWTLEDWTKVLWTDESKYEVFGSRRRIFVRRSATERLTPQCVAPTVKHGGGSVMVWGCFAMRGVGDLVQIRGILKKEGYRDILENNMLPSGLRVVGEQFVLMQDNDPKHSSKLCRGYVQELEDRGVLKNMVWPPQSPDLNPIELLWDELDRIIRQSCPSSEKHLWTLLHDAWSHLQSETLTKLVSRMPRLCQAVIKANGGYFDEKTV